MNGGTNISIDQLIHHEGTLKRHLGDDDGRYAYELCLGHTEAAHAARKKNPKAFETATSIAGKAGRFNLSEKQVGYLKKLVKQLRSEKQVDTRENWAKFVIEHTDEAEFLLEYAPTNDFYASLKSQAEQRGSLSPKQLAAIRKKMA